MCISMCVCVQPPTINEIRPMFEKRAENSFLNIIVWRCDAIVWENLRERSVNLYYRLFVYILRA